MNYRALAGLNPGQHACCFYRGDAQVVTTAVALAEALPDHPGLHLFFAAGELEAGTLSLLRAGFGAKRNPAGPKLAVFPGPLAGPEQIVRETDAYLREHGTVAGIHLNIMATGLAAGCPPARWFWHLSALDSYLRAKNASCLSFYRESSFLPEFIFQCLRVHPILMAESTALDNPHFIPPASLAAGLNPATPEEAGPKVPEPVSSALAAVIPAPVVQTDAGGCVTRVNARAADLLAGREGTTIGQPYVHLLHPADRDRSALWLAQLMNGRQAAPLEVRLSPPGTAARVRCHFLPLEKGCLIIWEDLSLADRLETATTLNQRLTELCNHLREQTVRDPLTGLYNRQYFEEELARCRNPRHWPVSVLVIDVDDLKLINDTYGHARGDLVLKKAAEAIKTPFREGDVVARIGGDEFAVVLPRTDQATACDRKEQILNAVAAETSRGRVVFHLSIGTATAAGPDLSQLVDLADRDMYRAKERANHPRRAGT